MFPSFSSPRAQFHYERLQLRFPGQLRGALKPLTLAISTGENTVRNNGNIMTINGRVVRPGVVNGRLSYDLLEVAEALGTDNIEAPVPKVQSPRDRPQKAGLVAAGSAA